MGLKMREVEIEKGGVVGGRRMGREGEEVVRVGEEGVERVGEKIE